MSAFIKFMTGTRSRFGARVEYTNGLMVDPEAWNPRMGDAGGYYATTYEHGWKWSRNDTTHVADVAIPPTEFQVALGDGRIKSHSVIISNIRPVIDILNPYPVAVQVHIYHTYPKLMQELGVEVTPEMLEADAPSELTKCEPHDNTVVRTFSNGLVLTGTFDHETNVVYTGVYTRTAVWLNRDPTPTGTWFTCSEWRNGHAYGAGRLTHPDGSYITGTFLHSAIDGDAIDHTSAGEPTPRQYAMGVPVVEDDGAFRACPSDSDDSEEEEKGEEAKEAKKGKKGKVLELDEDRRPARRRMPCPK